MTPSLNGVSPGPTIGQDSGGRPAGLFGREPTAKERTMSRRLYGQAAGVAAAGALVVAMSMSALGRGSGAPPPPLVITAYNGGPPVSYTPPRTAWGEPDLQGVWSSDDMSGIPIARPQQFGDRLYLNDEEFAARARQVEAGVHLPD